jgi:proteasome lid subunit RPN8/RPN11
LITLDLHSQPIVPLGAVSALRPDVSLSSIELRLQSALRDLSVLLNETRSRTLLVPTDALFRAFSSLFPVERMGIMAARNIAGNTIVGSMYDITGTGHRAHVRADSGKLAEALIQMDRSGSHLAVWIHSHPGASVVATTPSGIDRDQYADLIRDYGSDLVGIIVADGGHVRFWGDAVESGQVRIELAGDGMTPIQGQHHVYRINQ